VLNTARDYLYAIATYLNGIWKIPIQSTLPVSTSNCTFLNSPASPPSSSLATAGQLYDGALATSLWYRYQPGAVAIDNQDNLYVIDQWASTK